MLYTQISGFRSSNKQKEYETIEYSVEKGLSQLDMSKVIFDKIIENLDSFEAVLFINWIRNK